VRLRIPKRAQNTCSDCGYTWNPRGKDLSHECPQCGGGNVAYDRSGCFLFAGIVVVAVVVCIIGMLTKKDPDGFKPESFGQRLIETPPPTPIIEAPVEPLQVERMPTSEATPRPPPVTDTAPVPLPRPRAEFEKYMSVEEAKREAVRRYPELAIPDSKMNSEFIRLHDLYRKTRPDFLRAPTWPLRLADEAAKEP
jgi:predicted RNA-binding Zn-ribbon protein involved in translation (DUF1610 family)